MSSLRAWSGKRLLTCVVACALTAFACERTSKETPEAVAYYFHNTIRCESCIKIEKCSREALEERFGALLESGALQWRMVNMELDKNQHFVKEYDLGMPTLVLSKLAGGKETRWKNLEGAWDHLQDDAAMKAYFLEETVKFLQGSEATPPPTGESLRNPGTQGGKETEESQKEPGSREKSAGGEEE